MKRHFPGLHADTTRVNDFLEGIFLARVDRAYYRWHPQKPFFILSFTVLAPQELRLPQDCGTPLLHPEVPLEIELVSARFRL